MVMHTLPADVTKNPAFPLVPLKGARAAGEGRLVVLAPATARAARRGRERRRGPAGAGYPRCRGGQPRTGDSDLTQVPGQPHARKAAE
jgi:hypothetical protein